MILFIEKTWYLWWMLGILTALRWFHRLSTSAKMEDLDAPAPEEEEEAYILSWRILHKAQVISWSETESASWEKKGRGLPLTGCR